MLSQEPDEQLPRDDRHKAIARADRRFSKYERESRFLNKMSEDYKVFDNVFDVPTLLTINELRSDGILQYIKSSLATGKESKVYLAVAPDGSLRTVKIYLTVGVEFKNMQTAHVSGVWAPLPIAVRKNVLVMEFIGDGEGNPTPPLVNTEELTSDDYQEVIKQMTILYQKARLVHADLSEYNIFKTPLGIMLFDFGSAIDIQHPNSKQFLVRDVMNINRFFEKRGIDVLNIAQVVEKIRGDTK